MSETPTAYPPIKPGRVPAKFTFEPPDPATARESFYRILRDLPSLRSLDDIDSLFEMHKTNPFQFLRTFIDLSLTPTERAARTDLFNSMFDWLETNPPGGKKLTRNAKVGWVANRVLTRLYQLPNTKWFEEKWVAEGHGDKKFKKVPVFNPNFDPRSDSLGQVLEFVSKDTALQIKTSKFKAEQATLDTAEQRALGYIFNVKQRKGKQVKVDDEERLTAAEMEQKIASDFTGFDGGTEDFYNSIMRTDGQEYKPFSAFEKRKERTWKEIFKSVDAFTAKDMGLSEEDKKSMDGLFSFISDKANESKGLIRQMSEVDLMRLAGYDSDELKKLSGTFYRIISNYSETRDALRSFQKIRRKYVDTAPLAALDAYYSIDIYNPTDDRHTVVEVTKLQMPSVASHIDNTQKVLWKTLTDGLSNLPNFDVLKDRFVLGMMEVTKGALDFARKIPDLSSSDLVEALEETVKRNAEDVSKHTGESYHQLMRSETISKRKISPTDIDNWLMTDIAPGIEETIDDTDNVPRQAMVDATTLGGELTSIEKEQLGSIEGLGQPSPFEEAQYMSAEEFDQLSPDEKINFERNNGRILGDNDVNSFGRMVLDSQEMQQILRSRGFHVLNSGEIVDLRNGEFIQRLSDIDKASPFEIRLDPSVYEALGHNLDIEKDRKIYLAAQEDLRARGVSIDRTGNMVDEKGYIIEDPNIREAISMRGSSVPNLPDFSC